MKGKFLGSQRPWAELSVSKRLACLEVARERNDSPEMRHLRYVMKEVKDQETEKEKVRAKALAYIKAKRASHEP